MKNNISSFLSRIVFFAVSLTGIHYLIHKALPQTYQVDTFYEIHIFLFILTLLSHFGLMVILKKNVDFMGYGFIAASFIKMIICVLFLLPVILNQTESTNSYVFQFFFVYFGYLAFEVVILYKELNK